MSLQVESQIAVKLAAWLPPPVAMVGSVGVCVVTEAV
jgi:hypothetical protein